jgi:hypothetical protein
MKKFIADCSIEDSLNSAITSAKEGNIAKLESFVEGIYASINKIESEENYSAIKEKVEDILLKTRYLCYQNCVMNKILAFKNDKKEVELPKKTSVKKLNIDENLTKEENLAVNFLYDLKIKVNSASLAKTITQAIKYTEEKKGPIQLYPRIVQIIETAKECSKILGLEREMSPIISTIEKKYELKYFQAKTR